MLKNLAAFVGLCLLVALFVVNLLGGLISGIWLAILGEWRTVFLGFVFTFGMTWAWPIAMLPSLALTAFITSNEKGKLNVPLPLLVWGALYSNSLICAWVLLCFWFFSERIGNQQSLPFLLWAYSTAMSPFAYMSSKGREENWAESLGIVGAIATYLLLLVLHSLGSSMTSMIWGTALVGVALGLTSVVLGLAIEREQRSSGTW